MTDPEALQNALSILNSLVAGGCQMAAAPGQHQFTLTEKKEAAQGRLDKIHINDIKHPFSLFFPDKARPELCAFLEEGKTQKACDSIIATYHDGKFYLIVCELKSGRAQGVVAQMKNTAAFVDLLLSLALHHHDLDLTHWERRYVVLGAGRINKTPTRPGQSKAGSSPTNYRVFFVKNKQQLPIGSLCR
jgi:hypothetical protein